MVGKQRLLDQIKRESHKYILTENQTQLKNAVFNGDLDTIKQLHEAGEVDIHFNHDCILRIAAEMGLLQIVEYLLDNGADIHALDDSALDVACWRNNLEMAKFLVERGADIHANDSHTFVLSVEEQNWEIVEFFIKNGIKWQDYFGLEDFPSNIQMYIVREWSKDNAN